MSKFFIHHPKFALVIAIFISLAGLLSMSSLPVAQFPAVAPPQISISATYSGASSKVLEDSVTSIIEEQLNGAKGLIYYESSSNSNGSAEITATFAPGTDPDLAQVDVQNRLKNAESRLPTEVKQLGVQVEQAGSNFLMIYSLMYKDDEKNITELADYATRNINNEIRRIPGVGKVMFFGAEASMRVWIDPQKLIGYNLSIQDVSNAITAQNIQVPAGSFGSSPSTNEQELTATIAVKGTLDTPDEFGQIVLYANTDGSIVYLKDVARLEIGPQSYNFNVRVNGKPATAAAVQLSPGANALATADAVKNRLQELSANFPDNIKYSTSYDTSKFVEVAISKVISTLFEAIGLVILVMFLFLQNFRYTFIPTIVVPVCLLGTLAFMLFFGFSINMMTMFGMVLAIGILVDDAIVVVENVERIMVEEGLNPKEATIKAMHQVSGAIVAITLVLVAVFLPLAFMSGSVGIIYRQFSVSLAVSILFSGILALILTPALCALILKPIPKGYHEDKKGFFGWFNKKFAKLTRRYEWLNSKLVKRTNRYMVIYLLLIGIIGLLYIRVPETFVPVEDQGFMLTDVQLPPGATFSRSEKTIEKIEHYMMSRESIESITVVSGYSFSGMGENAALAFSTLKDWSLRDSSQSVMAETDRFNASFGANKDGTVFSVTPPPIDGLGNSGGFSLRLQNRAALSPDRFNQIKDELLSKANQSPKIAYAMLEGLNDAPQLRLEIDREKAKTYGVNFNTITNAISNAYGSAIVNDFANKGRMQRVVIQADIKNRMTPETIEQLYIPNQKGEQIPLRTFISTKWESGAVQLSRYNGYPAFKITGDAAPGYSTGEAMAELERIVTELPKGVGYEWTGLSYQEKQAGSQVPSLFALSVLVVFLLLVALHESWSIPAAIMLIVPIGALGSILAVMVLGMANDVYFKVGLITIIGLSAKNAILIVEFAKELHAQGHNYIDAAIQGARLRFRPIVMTSLAFILGVVPLAMATGAGAASQRSIGTGVIGGMLSATTIGVLFVPIFYVWIIKLSSNNKISKRLTHLFSKIRQHKILN